MSNHETEHITRVHLHTLQNTYPMSRLLLEPVLSVSDSPYEAKVRCVPEDTTVSAVALPSEEARLDTPSLGFGLADTTPEASPPSVAASWSPNPPGRRATGRDSCMLLSYFMVIKWPSIHGRCRADRRPWFFRPSSRSTGTPGVDQIPGGELVRDRLFVHISVAYFAAHLHICRQFPYPQPGDAPGGMLMPSRRSFRDIFSLTIINHSLDNLKLYGSHYRFWINVFRDIIFDLSIISMLKTKLRDNKSPYITRSF